MAIFSLSNSLELHLPRSVSTSGAIGINERQLCEVLALRLTLVSCKAAPSLTECVCVCV